MIILDEDLDDPYVRKILERCDPGRIASVRELGFGDRDDIDIPVLLHEHPDCTFITANIRDYWRKIGTHRRYCIVCIEKAAIVEALPRLFRFALFSTRRSRCGRMILVIRNSSHGYLVRFYQRHGDEEYEVALPD